MMFPLHFHYEDVLRQDLLLKLNHANVMEVPGLFEIRLVPKAPYDPLYGAFKVPHAVKQDFDLDLGEQTQLRHPAKYLY